MQPYFSYSILTHQKKNRKRKFMLYVFKFVHLFRRTPLVFHTYYCFLVFSRFVFIAIFTFLLFKTENLELEIQGLSRVNFAICARLICIFYFFVFNFNSPERKIKKINLGVIYILKICYNVLVAVGEPCIIHKLGGLQNG